MYKHIALLVRQPELTHEEFIDYWQTNHTPIAKQIEGVVRYHTVLPVDATAAEFDGIAELYFDTLEDLYDALGSPGSRDYDPTKEMAAKARDDVDNFLAVEDRPRFIGEEHVELDDTNGDTTDLYKHSAFLVRNSDMSHEAFLDHWESNHVPLARDIPGVVRYTRVTPAQPENAEFDGVAELYFEDLSALRAALGHSDTRDYDPDDPRAKAAREDVDNFLALEDRPRFIGQETVQLDTTRGTHT